LHLLWRTSVADGPLDPFAEASGPWGIVFLCSPDGDVGPTKLVAVDRAGRIRTVVLTRIRSGSHQTSPRASLFSGAQPGLAIDPSARIAYVVGGGGIIAAVDLQRLAVGYHQVTRRPAAATKVLTGPTRKAVWLGAGRIAIAGEDDRESLAANGDYRQEVRPVGLLILDTRSWTSRSVDRNAVDVTYTAGMLVSCDYPSGIGGYSATGARRFHLATKSRGYVLARAGGLLYVSRAGVSGPIVTIIDPRSGTALRDYRERPSTPFPLW
jgi:hypothetical protein